MNGLDIYKTKSGFTVLRLHYSADPSKDPQTPEGAKWLENAIKGIPGGLKSPKWRCEYEIDFSASGGELVFPELFEIAEEVYIDPFQIPEYWDRYASFDYGVRNPSAFHLYAVDPNGWKYVYFEFYAPGVHYKELCKIINSHTDYPKLHYIASDPSLVKKDQQGASDIKSMHQLFLEEGVYLRCDGIHNSDMLGIERIRDHWHRPHGQKALRIFKNCPKLWWELRNLKYAENKSPDVRTNPERIVDKDNHGFDGLKYFITSRPFSSEEPKPKTIDPAIPIAGDLIDLTYPELSRYERFKQAF